MIEVDKAKLEKLLAHINKTPKMCENCPVNNCSYNDGCEESIKKWLQNITYHSDLNIGDAFIYKGTLYIKCETVEEYHHLFNSFNPLTGETELFELENIEPVKIDISIKE